MKNQRNTMPTLIDVSVYMITKNEAHFLSETLECLRRFREVIIVDCGSTDNTSSIARLFPNVRWFHHDWAGFAKQKQVALDKCSSQWVLNVDADEHVTDDLVKDIECIVQENIADGLLFVISDVFQGHPCRRWKICERIHCFRKSCGRYDLTNDVHEGIVYTGRRPLRTTSAVLHYGNPNIRIIVDKQNIYSTLKAQERFRKGKRAPYLKLLLVNLYAFLFQYIGKQNYRDGVRGFIRSVLLAHYAFMKEAKLFEAWLQKNEV